MPVPRYLGIADFPGGSFGNTALAQRALNEINKHMLYLNGFEEQMFTPDGNDFNLEVMETGIIPIKVSADGALKDGLKVGQRKLFTIERITARIVYENLLPAVLRHIPYGFQRNFTSATRRRIALCHGVGIRMAINYHEKTTSTTGIMSGEIVLGNANALATNAEMFLGSIIGSSNGTWEDGPISEVICSLINPGVNIGFEFILSDTAVKSVGGNDVTTIFQGVSVPGQILMEWGVPNANTWQILYGGGFTIVAP